MNYVTFLGPVGATFSHEAYNVLSKTYNAPSVDTDTGDALCLPTSTNREILGEICKHSGYGSIAMETVADARVTESLEGFIALLQNYDKLKIPGISEGCPIHVIGAIRMELHFCLMVNPGVDLKCLQKVFAHPKAAGACKRRIEKNQLQVVEVTSNGEGARLVAEDAKYLNYASIGPKSAAQKYKLHILDENFEDNQAITTFFLIAPRIRKVSIGQENRALIVFRLEHQPGSLVRALQPFADLNLIQIHSVHTGNHSYDFAIEIDVKDHELPKFHEATIEFAKCVQRHLTFGPFQVLSK